MRGAVYSGGRRTPHHTMMWNTALVEDRVGSCSVPVCVCCIVYEFHELVFRLLVIVCVLIGTVLL